MRSLSRRKSHDSNARLLGAAHESLGACYIINSEFRFIYCNPAWDRFASENGAPELTGRSVLGLSFWDFTPPELRSFFARSLEYVHHTGDLWQHTYENSSPQKHRIYEMRIRRLTSPERFLFENVLVVEHEHEYEKQGNTQYAKNGGSITMCSHCRYTRRLGEPTVWDFVPSHLQGKMLNVVHRLCPLCRAYFYPEAGSFDIGRDGLKAGGAFTLAN